jgi:hypothetical protein
MGTICISRQAICKALRRHLALAQVRRLAARADSDAGLVIRSI